MPDPTTTTAKRLKVCAACGKVDDAPRHNIGVPADHPQATPTREFLESIPDGTPAAAIAELLTPTQVSRHIDCCAAAGCVICQETEGITGGVRDDALWAAIEGGALADHEPPQGLSNEELGLDG